jgi:PadR family transcriptional regulator PadR
MNSKFSPELMRGSLDLMVLSVLAEGSKYGYLIQRKLREASREMVSVEAGTLYPLLHRLEDERLIKSKWDRTSGRRRKWYVLTATGRVRLRQQGREWHVYADCLRRLLLGVVDPPPKPA